MLELCERATFTIFKTLRLGGSVYDGDGFRPMSELPMTGWFIIIMSSTLSRAGQV